MAAVAPAVDTAASQGLIGLAAVFLTVDRTPSQGLILGFAAVFLTVDTIPSQGLIAVSYTHLRAHET